tara:strand:- start:186 stop:479 length:294 start_codon:yes stop_codon:yes gene_type:complete
MDTQKLNDILENFSNLEEKLNNLNSNDFSDYAKLSKEYSDLKPLTDMINDFFRCEKEIKDLDELLISEDEEIKAEAINEKNILLEKKKKQKMKLKYF